MFKQLNLEKTTKWFLNFASDKLLTENPANKLSKYFDKYQNPANYDKKEKMQTDLHDHFKNIFDESQRDKNASIENFLKENQQHPQETRNDLADQL